MLARPDRALAWHCGGAILTRICARVEPLSPTAAQGLAGDLSRQALTLDTAGDEAAAKWCAGLALQLFGAVHEAERWARAAA